MARVRHSRVLYKELDRVFNDNSKRKLDACTCVMAVLFEDLRIEIAGLAETEVKPMDIAGNRISYFLRRSIATLKEFAHAITDLDRLPEFSVVVKAKFDAKTTQQWNRAVRYFNRYGRTLITPVRHAIGGHFRHTTAEHAIENEIRGGLPGAIEVTGNEAGTGGFVLHFATHIANGAITEKVPGTAEFGRKFRFLFRRTRVGYQHAVRATEAVAMYYLWSKFL